jgi:hypothetical protein
VLILIEIALYNLQVLFELNFIATETEGVWGFDHVKEIVEEFT